MYLILRALQKKYVTCYWWSLPLLPLSSAWNTSVVATGEPHLFLWDSCDTPVFATNTPRPCISKLGNASRHNLNRFDGHHPKPYKGNKIHITLYVTELQPHFFLIRVVLTAHLLPLTLETFQTDKKKKNVRVKGPLLQQGSSSLARKFCSKLAKADQSDDTAGSEDSPLVPRSPVGVCINN